jgi:hypothetical protein
MQMCKAEARMLPGVAPNAALEIAANPCLDNSLKKPNTFI